MTWEDKFERIQLLAALAGSLQPALRMRKPGDWYVESVGWVGKGDGFLRVGGGGSTPEAAVDDKWATITAPGAYVKINGSSDKKAWTWNERMGTWWPTAG